MKEYEIREAGKCAHLKMAFHENHNGHIIPRLVCDGCNWKHYCIKLIKPMEDTLNIGRPLRVNV